MTTKKKSKTMPIWAGLMGAALAPSIMEMVKPRVNELSEINISFKFRESKSWSGFGGDHDE